MPRFVALDDVSLHGKRVLVRLDINVPMRNGKIMDTTRLERSLPTVRDLVRQGAVVVILAHLGRPNGAVVPDLSLEPLAAAIAEVLAPVSVRFVPQAIGSEAAAIIADARPGTVLVLENIRFYPGEEANELAFVRELASLGDVYVNDAFSVAHRAHASTAGLAQMLPAVAGRLMEEELNALEGALSTPVRPVAAVVGGAKVSTKIALLRNLVSKVDVLAIGGGMANTFLAALGHDVGASLQEPSAIATALDILGLADEAGCRILLPTDALVAPRFSADAPVQTVPATAIPAGMMILDIGPATIGAWASVLSECRTIVWNGPVGAFELAPFSSGTIAIAQLCVGRTLQGARTVAGGGDTIAALALAGALDKLSYVSTAGGAFLEWLEGRELPGVKALEEAAGFHLQPA
ncbi:MAG: phosphoglycerate kinase [Holosporales bacterium]|jgi:phosphoglycerate kinase